MSDRSQEESAGSARAESPFLGSGGDRIALLILGVMILGMLADLWYSANGAVPSHRIGDTTRYFVFSREFGYAQLAQGNLALWNPHLFSGTHFVGAFQPAMLYPPNLIYLFLSLPAGINFEIALHLSLLAVFTYTWVRGQGLSWQAALISAAIATFGATASLRVLAGQLSVLDTIAWVPLLLCCIDALSRKVNLGWTLTAGLGTTMILLAGHPPTAFMCALTLSLYCVPALLTSGERGRFIASLTGMVFVSVLLAGVQLAMGLEAARESVREVGMSFDFATTFSLPPENLLSLAVPYLFGTPAAPQTSYFGRWWYWDDSTFIGVSSLMLVFIGICGRRRPLARKSLALAIVMIVFALGRYTPVYHLLYSTLPGFDLLRSPSKFMFFATLFLALLAGLGVERLLEGGAEEGEASEQITRRRASWLLMLVGTLTLGAGVWVSQATPDGPSAHSPITWLAALDDRHDFSPQDLARWSAIASPSILTAGALCIGLALLFFVASRQSRVNWLPSLIIAICLIELFTFARANRGGVRSKIWHRDIDSKAFAEAGEGRVLERSRLSNYAMVAPGFSVWGYDPVILGRSVRFMARAQGREVADLNNVGGRIPSRYDPLMRLLRMHAAVGLRGSVHEYPGAIGRFSLIGRHRVLTEPAAILDAMQDVGFDPRELVILESAPEPLPAGGPVNGHVQVSGESSDAMRLEVEVDGPAILLISDAYARGWRARAGSGSDQQRYRVQPADLMLRAIALDAGHHVIHLEYAPNAYRAGQIMSATGGAIALAALLVWFNQMRARRQPPG